VTGYLAPIGEVEQMADAGVALLRDADVWFRASTAAQHLARERFGAAAIVPRYEAYYREVIGRRPLATREAST